MMGSGRGREKAGGARDLGTTPPSDQEGFKAVENPQATKREPRTASCEPRCALPVHAPPTPKPPPVPTDPRGPWEFDRGGVFFPPWRPR